MIKNASFPLTQGKNKYHTKVPGIKLSFCDIFSFLLSLQTIPFQIAFWDPLGHTYHYFAWWDLSGKTFRSGTRERLCLGSKEHAAALPGKACLWTWNDSWETHLALAKCPGGTNKSVLAQTQTSFHPPPCGAGVFGCETREKARPL